jgi:hypothetical protein
VRRPRKRKKSPVKESSESEQSKSLDRYISAEASSQRQKLVEESEGNLCGICLENINDTDKLANLPGCEHVFHVECIQRWSEE